MADDIDIRLHVDRIPSETLYRVEHCLELGYACIGFVFRNPVNKEVIVVFDNEARNLTDSEARRLMTPPSS